MGYSQQHLYPIQPSHEHCLSAIPASSHNLPPKIHSTLPERTLPRSRARASPLITEAERKGRKFAVLSSGQPLISLSKEDRKQSLKLQETHTIVPLYRCYRIIVISKKLRHTRSETPIPIRRYVKGSTNSNTLTSTTTLSSSITLLFMINYNHAIPQQPPRPHLQSPLLRLRLKRTSKTRHHALKLVLGLRPNVPSRDAPTHHHPSTRSARMSVKDLHQ
jgi:hypothetical protein